MGIAGKACGRQAGKEVGAATLPCVRAPVAVPDIRALSEGKSRHCQRAFRRNQPAAGPETLAAEFLLWVRASRLGGQKDNVVAAHRACFCPPPMMRRSGRNGRDADGITNV